MRLVPTYDAQVIFPPPGPLVFANYVVVVGSKFLSFQCRLVAKVAIIHRITHAMVPWNTYKELERNCRHRICHVLVTTGACINIPVG